MDQKSEWSCSQKKTALQGFIIFILIYILNIK